MKTIIRKSWLIAVAMIIVGALLLGSGWALGAREGVALDRSGVHVIKNETVSEATDLPGEFDEITINVGYGGIELLPSKDGEYHLEYTLNSTQNPKISVKPGVLEFDATGKDPANLAIVKFDFETGRNYVRLYYPEYGKPPKLTIISDSGDIDVTGLGTGEMNIKSDYGNVKLDRIYAGSLIVNSSSGKCTVTDSYLSDCVVRSSYGDIELRGVTAFGTNIKASGGRISLSGYFYGQTVIDSDYGDIYFATDEAKETYGYEIGLKYGELRIDGKKTEHGEAEQDSDIAANKLKISSSSGDVSVNFG
jgi:hypothetical protein